MFAAMKSGAPVPDIAPPPPVATQNFQRTDSSQSVNKQHQIKVFNIPEGSSQVMRPKSKNLYFHFTKWPSFLVVKIFCLKGLSYVQKKTINKICTLCNFILRKHSKNAKAWKLRKCCFSCYVNVKIKKCLIILHENW